MFLAFIFSLPWQFISGRRQHSLLFTMGMSNYRIEFCDLCPVSVEITLFPGLSRTGEEYLRPVQRPAFLSIFMMCIRRF
jgi:hypothetical protein